MQLVGKRIEKSSWTQVAVVAVESQSGMKGANVGAVNFFGAEAFKCL